MAKLSLDERLNQIEKKISDQSFRNNKGLGNEVGYYIFDYDPRQELHVRNHIQYLKNRINESSLGFRIISKIVEHDLTDGVVFLTGVGKCHPIIASHNILNNLHQVLDSVPVVMFYPGEYSGQDLKLFGTMDSRNYYRAFRLV